VDQISSGHRAEDSGGIQTFLIPTWAAGLIAGSPCFSMGI
jgi:hypothetical protein